ncbi:MAG: type II secretion system F family protein [Acidobacteriota bacterium]
MAPDEDALREELARRDLHVFEMRPSGAGLSVGGVRLGGSAKKVPRRQFLLFNQELVTLIRAGLPLLQCLDVLLERMKEGPFKRYLEDIRERLRGGSSLSEAFAAQGEAFPRVYSATLASGERSGDLAGVLTRFVDFTRKTEALRSRVRAALTYPVLLTGMSLALVALLLFYILPSFSSFYSEFGRELPAITDLVVGISLFLQGNAIWIFGGLAIAIVAFKVYKGTPAGRFTIDRLTLRIPFLGGILRKYNVSQYCRTLATMLQGGIPLVTSLQTTGEALDNQAIAQAVQRATEDVREGMPLWQSLDDTGEIPDLAIEMTKVGESTGDLPAMLSDVSGFYDEQVDEAMTRAVSLFEPLLLIIMGSLIAFLLLAMYLPIFQLAGQS